MSRTKTIPVVLNVAVALCAVIANSASASWFIAGAELTGSAALSSTAQVDVPEVFTIPVLGITLECSGGFLEDNGSWIGAKFLKFLKKVKFEGCKVIKPSTCTLSSSNLSLLPLVATLSLGAGGSARARYTPQTSSLLGFLPFAEGTVCVLEGEQPIKGAVTMNMPTGQTEELAQAVEGLGSIENNSLEVGAGNKIFLTGKALLKLASGLKWSFR